VRFEQISAKEKTGKMYEKLKQVIVEIAKTIPFLSDTTDEY
jgi:hypothetical protein